MRNPGLNEAKAGIKITKRNINNLRYADDTTLMHSLKLGIENNRDQVFHFPSQEGKWQI